MISRLGLGTAMIGLALLVGCQSAPMTVRGQNPMPPGPAMNPSAAPVPGPVYYEPSAHHGADVPAAHCHPNGAQCPLCAPDNFWTPTHHHTFDYKQPKNLSYPPHNQPAGVVVYPYYTCKGPSDFFMK